MQVGFFFWPYTLDLCEQLAERGDRYGYAMIGIADTPGNAMDPWVSAAMVARASRRARVAVCVTNLLTRHPAITAAAVAAPAAGRGPPPCTVWGGGAARGPPPPATAALRMSGCRSRARASSRKG